jgi:flagellin-like protein
VKDVKGEDGVSEIIGTILVLAITVALFSTVFAYIQYIPPATVPEQVTISPSVSLDGADHVLYLNLTENTGSIIARSSTFLMVFIDGREYPTSIASLPMTGPSYSSQKDFGPGDTINWESTFAGITVQDNATFYALLFYKPSSQTLWRSQTFSADEVSIVSAYFYPSPLVPGSQYEIVVDVITLDLPLLKVSANLTTLYNVTTNVTMPQYIVTGNSVTLVYSSTAPDVIPKNASAVIYVQCGPSTSSSIIQLS